MLFLVFNVHEGLDFARALASKPLVVTLYFLINFFYIVSTEYVFSQNINTFALIVKYHKQLSQV